jgi:hypothetical protein
VRIDLPGPQKILSLAEVEVFSGSENIARAGEATQSTVDYEGHPQLAIDGNTNGHYFEAKSTTHTQVSDDPWWELDLKSTKSLDRIQIWNRTDNGLHVRLVNFRLSILDENRGVIYATTVSEAPNPNAMVAISGAREVPFVAAIADYAQPSFAADQVIGNMDLAERGWAIGGQPNAPHSLTLIPSAAVDVAPGSKLGITIEQVSKHEYHTLGRFRLAVSADSRAAELSRLPADVLAILKTDAAARTDEQNAALTRYYLVSVAPELQPVRERLAEVEKQLAEQKPMTTVPIMSEVPAVEHRATRIQFRGNFLDLGNEVQPGVPAVFQPLPADMPANRLAVAKWLIDDNNPLTARVITNRFWEQIFGIGIVRTSEEFGAQGELPSHPELLDWLATELVRERWDVKRFLKLLVTSAAYRQSSRVTPESFERDPENRLLARGPRFRLSAEMIRDQALAVSGLLSAKMYGPPVKPPQPAVGLSAAFGSGIDWQTSGGEDKFRRALYTTWRRSNPYPSMTTFDAPNREVCTVRRSRTNTPLQALVTLNDPVYVEAAQAMARQMIAVGTSPQEKVTHGFRRALIRDPNPTELGRLTQLFDVTYAHYAQHPDLATKMATDPLGAAHHGHLAGKAQSRCLERPMQWHWIHDPATAPAPGRTICSCRSIVDRMPTKAMLSPKPDARPARHFSTSLPTAVGSNRPARTSANIGNSSSREGLGDILRSMTNRVEVVAWNPRHRNLAGVRSTDFTALGQPIRRRRLALPPENAEAP